MPRPCQGGSFNGCQDVVSTKVPDRDADQTSVIQKRSRTEREVLPEDAELKRKIQMMELRV